MWVWRVPSAPKPQLSQTETYAIVDPLRGDPRFERASPPQDLPHFPRNHTRDSTHYLSRRPEVSSQDEKSRKAETRGSLGTPGVTISKRLCGIPFMARPPVVSGGRPSFRCVPFGFAQGKLGRVYLFANDREENFSPMRRAAMLEEKNPLPGPELHAPIRNWNGFAAPR